MTKFLIEQYNADKLLKIKHNYLNEQFYDYKKIFKEIEKVVKFGDFTLGKKVIEFEKNISKLLKSKFVVSVGSGTDALFLSLKALGIKEGDEVITPSYTFYATIGAIVTAGAKPVFVDIKEDYNLDESLIEKKITKKTKAILPVHWAGRICEMTKIMQISKKYNIPVVEDACHGILATYNNKFAGTFGDFGCFSMHPLKNLNIWGDGGFMIIKKKSMYKKMLLLRNHGLASRNKNLIFGYNSRLDTVQSVVALHLLKKIKKITNTRIRNANYLDKKLCTNKNIKIIKRQNNLKEVYHLYHINILNKKLRNYAVKKLIKNSIDAKTHYPVPMHLQPPSKKMGYKKGDFPITEKMSDTSISLPVHEFVTIKMLDKIVKVLNSVF
jgi:dTDP-3-amino-2,3,6-trideoxy-4-keto-D-glucose/dTDP-3-amino-3,4,6-trideoxy-alpha-D-glucose/dTDP-2,6-dideoxy-D-kanosamine transaminase